MNWRSGLSICILFCHKTLWFVRWQVVWTIIMRIRPQQESSNGIGMYTKVWSEGTEFDDKGRRGWQDYEECSVRWNSRSLGLTRRSCNWKWSLDGWSGFPRKQEWTKFPKDVWLIVAAASVQVSFRGTLVMFPSEEPTVLYILLFLFPLSRF